MKIISSISGHIYNYQPINTGENKDVCPECSKNRKKQKQKVFSWNGTKNVGYCNHCNAYFTEYKNKIDVKEYKLPEWQNNTNISDGVVKWFESRKISQKTLNIMRIYSQDSAIKFPFFNKGRLINIKSRTKDKKFWLETDAEKILYNIDTIYNNNEIIITEGEIDALSFIEVGLTNVVSVPNGANNHCDYLDNYIELFEGKQIIIAVDQDSPGLILRNELIRRFGSENCSIINFKDCKDANEYLCRYNNDSLIECYKNRYDIPIEGIIDLERNYDDIYDLYKNGLKSGLKLNDELDNIITWESSRVAIWTGIPTHGKSEAVDAVCVKLNNIHKWKVAYFSPENYPIKYHVAKLMSKITGLPFNNNDINEDEFQNCLDYIENNFYFIYPEKELTLDNILERIRYLIKKYGVKCIVLDPYNKFEHLRPNGMSETEYISKFLDKITTFAKTYDVLINLVAHPTKMKMDAARLKYEVPTLYDIAGSAHFYNKADYGICIYRNYETKLTEFHVQKVKFKHLGEGGTIYKKYNYNNGRYENADSTVDMWNENSLLKNNINEVAPF